MRWTAQKHSTACWPLAGIKLQGLERAIDKADDRVKTAPGRSLSALSLKNDRWLLDAQTAATDGIAAIPTGTVTGLQ